jgi:hypothetical protein
MEYPYKLGIEMPENIRHRFETEAHEYLIACINEYDHGSIKHTELRDGFGVAGNFEHWTEIIGFVDLTTGAQSRGKGTMKWTTAYYEPQWYPDKKAEMDAIHKAVEEQFRPGVIYRVKGYPPISLPDEELFNNASHLKDFYLTEMLSEGEQNEFLQGLLDSYYTKVTAHSDVFGDMELDKELMWYETDVLCGRSLVYVRIQVEDENEDITASLADLEAFWSKKAAWDKKYRAFAAKQLLQQANEWQENIAEDGKKPKVYDEKSFTKALFTESIVAGNGSISIYYDDGGIFSGHAIEVKGTLKDGAQSAKMFG